MEEGSKRDTNNQRRKTMTTKITKSINNPRLIVWDAETDTHTGTHIPNLIIANVLQVASGHGYEDSLVEQKIFEGYNCRNDFGLWLFSDANANSTVIAHNGSGYDYKFVLKWYLEGGERPSTYICQGSHKTSMKFRRHNLSFVGIRR